MADEEMETVQVSTKKPTKGMAKYPYSPLQAGLLATVAAAPSGPLAPLVGLATGLFVRHRRNDYNDRQMQYLSNMDKEREGMNELLANEGKGATPEEQRMLAIAREMSADGYRRLASGDSSGEELIKKSQELLIGGVQGDIDQKRAEEKETRMAQRDLITTAAKAYRSEFQNAIDNAQALDQQISKILDLTKDPTLDPNKPINKAHLVDLISMNGMMFRDSPDAMDAVTQGAQGLQGFGARGAAAGGLIQGLAAYIKSSDYVVSAEDFNKIALNSRKFLQIYTAKKMDQLGDQTQSLEKFSRGLGLTQEDFSLRDYVTGGEKELRLTPEDNNSQFIQTPEGKWIPNQYGTNSRGEPRVTPTRGIIKRPTN